MKITRIQEEKALDAGTVLSSAGLADSPERGRDVCVDELDRGDRYYLAEQNGTPVGVMTWRQQGEIRHGLAEVYHIGVIPEVQGDGVAPQLFTYVVERIQEYYDERDGSLRKLFLLTHEDNERAQGFYEKMGMEHEATLPDHFHDDLDEHVYARYFQ